MWSNRVTAGTKGLDRVLQSTYTRRKGEQIQTLIDHNHPDFKGKSDDEIAAHIQQRENNDPLGARRFFAKHDVSTSNSEFERAGQSFFTQRDERELAKTRTSYQQGELSFNQAVNKMISQNTKILNDIERALSGKRSVEVGNLVLPEEYYQNNTTSEIIDIAKKIDPKKYDYNSSDFYQKVSTKVEKTFNSFKTMGKEKSVQKKRSIAHDGDLIDKSLRLLSDSLEMDNTEEYSRNNHMFQILGMMRISSEQSVSSPNTQNSHMERESQRRSIFPNNGQQR